MSIFESTGDQYRDRRNWQRFLDDLDRDDDYDDQPAPKTKATLGPFVVDIGPLLNTPEDERVIQAREDRITYLDRRDKGRH